MPGVRCNDLQVTTREESSVVHTLPYWVVPALVRVSIQSHLSSYLKDKKSSQTYPGIPVEAKNSNSIFLHQLSKRTSVGDQNLWGNTKNILVYVAIFIVAMASFFQFGSGGWKVTSSCCNTPTENVTSAWSAVNTLSFVRWTVTPGPNPPVL